VRHDGVRTVIGEEMCRAVDDVAALSPCSARTGRGKTTVVKILSTLLKADAGTANIDGFEIATQPRTCGSPSVLPDSSRPSTKCSSGGRTSCLSGHACDSGPFASAAAILGGGIAVVSQGTLTPLLRRNILIGSGSEVPNLRLEPAAFNLAAGDGHWSRDI